jgi:hypothetical protein
MDKFKKRQKHKCMVFHCDDSNPLPMNPEVHFSISLSVTSRCSVCNLHYNDSELSVVDRDSTGYCYKSNKFLFISPKQTSIYSSTFKQIADDIVNQCKIYAEEIKQSHERVFGRTI